ncbi:MAG: hypothetical protein JNM27_08830 [Leptospirales bacterium]|nr:hypothetical protein [Leptospirales bacterium]
MNSIHDFLNDPDGLYDRITGPDADLFFIEELLVAESLVRPEQPQTSLAEKLMDGPLLAVPEVLLNITEKVLKGEKQPSCVIKLGLADKLLALVDSTSYFVEEAAAEPLRSATLERRPVVHVQQRRGDFEYQIIRESDDDVMIAVRIKCSGVVRASLRKEGRIVASRTLPVEERNVAFEHLNRGHYELNLEGDHSDGFSFVISGDGSDTH